MTRAFLRLPLLLACLLALAFSAGCEALGNPPLARRTTDWTPWRSPIAETMTRAQSVPAAEWERLFALVPRNRLHHLDPVARRQHAVALVTVRPSWFRRTVPPRVTLITEFLLTTGETLQRSWSVPATEPTWFGLFEIPGPPRAAMTAIAF